MKQRYDIMLTGIAAAQAMRAAYVAFEEESMVGSEDADPDDLLEDTPECRNSLLCADTGFEDRLIANADESRYGEEATERHLRDMRRMAAREALPAIVERKLLMIEDKMGNLAELKQIREAQGIREVAYLRLDRNMVHAPAGDTTSAEYVAEQDRLEAEFARMNPTWYLQMNGGWHGTNITVGEVSRAQLEHPDFDERMNEAMSRIRPITRTNSRRDALISASPSPNQKHDRRRDSERP